MVVKDASGLDLAAYNAIDVIAGRGVYVPFLMYGWFNFTKVGSGDGWALINGLAINTGVTAESSCIVWEYITVSLGLVHYGFNFDRSTVMRFHLERMNADSEAVAYVQWKDSDGDPALADMAEKGFGLKIANYALLGESYGTELGEVDLATSLVDSQSMEIEIIHTPGVSIEWKVNGVSKGTQETLSMIPSGNALDVTRLCHAMKNGVTGGVEAKSYMTNFTMWQSKI